MVDSLPMMFYKNIPRYIYKHFRASHAMLNQNGMTVNLERVPFEGVPTSIMSTLQDSAYIQEEVIDFAKAKRIFKMSFRFDDTNVNIWAFEHSNTKINDYQMICSMVCHMIYQLNMMQRKEQVTIVLGFSKERKSIGKNGTILTSKNVNSGLTYMICVVYRQEELIKVMMHELMHYYGMDHHQPESEGSRLAKQIETEFRVKDTTANGVRLEESYNDTMTCLFIIGLYVLTRRRELPSMDEYFRLYGALYKKTVVHIVGRAARVLRHYGWRSMGDKGKNEFVEGTHVFSYYVCKAANFISMVSFNKLFITEKGSMPSLDHMGRSFLMSMNSGLWTSYCQHLQDVLNSEMFRTRMDRELKKTNMKNNSLCMMIDLDFSKKSK